MPQKKHKSTFTDADIQKGVQYLKDNNLSACISRDGTEFSRTSLTRPHTESKRRKQKYIRDVPPKGKKRGQAQLPLKTRNKDQGMPRQNARAKFVGALIIGMAIWLSSALYYGGLLGLPTFDLGIGWDIAFIFISLGMLVPLIYFAYTRRNQIAFFIFLLWAWLLGYMEHGILNWAISTGLEVELLRLIFFIATVIAAICVIITVLIGYHFADRYNFSLLTAGFIAFGISLLIIEPIFIFTLGFDAVITWTSLLVIAWIIGGALIDGKELKEDLNEDSWMLSVLNLFLDIIVVAIRLFIIFVQLLSRSDD